MSSDSLTRFGVTVQQALERVKQYEIYHERSRTQSATVHVPDIGSGLSLAYEQLRNASENIEDHLLFQRAMLRFYRRNLSFDGRASIEKMGDELVVELTQAGYVKNDTVPTTTVATLDETIRQYHTLHKDLRKKRSLNREDIDRWTLEVLSVRSEQLFHPPERTLSFAHVAATHFSQYIDVAEYVAEAETIAPEDYQKIVYIAVHKALLKSDSANIRSALLTIYGVDGQDREQFIAFNVGLDDLLRSKTAIAVTRLVSRNGAPLRVLNGALFRRADEEEAGADLDITKASVALSHIEARIDQDYQQARSNISSGVMKSIVFLFITKVIVGLLIEVPYDLLVYGMVPLVPLFINLFSPPVFLALFALTVRMPGETNKRAVVDYIDAMLYREDSELHGLERRQTVRNQSTFVAAYVLLALIIIGAVSFGLHALGFNIVQGIIFFVFFSTAMFLGYRLTLQVRELELVRTDSGGGALLRDFIFTPFIFIGQRISHRFSQLNIMAQMLDALVELPLKTFLRLVRQWTTFVNNRKDDLL